MGMLNVPCKALYEPVNRRSDQTVTIATKRDTLPANNDIYAELTRLLEYRRPMLLRIALRFTRDMEDAEDVVQEASLKALLHLESFRRESRLDTWLYAIISNTAVNIFRSRSRHREVSLEDLVKSDDNVEPQSIRDPQRSPEEVCVDRDLHEMVYAEVRCMKDQYRKAVTLCDLDGLSHSEAAASLNLNLLRFNARLHRGRRVLSKALRKRTAANRR